MPQGPFQPLLRYMYRMGGEPPQEQSDCQLLQQFTVSRDESAFESLVRRHGSLVWGVCRRMLSDLHDADDAFQATFLVLFRKAATLRINTSLGAWLYGVAYRISLKAQENAARRRKHEQRAMSMTSTESDHEPDSQEWRLLLDTELNQLPEKYRAPLVLCYLQGKTNEEAARDLGWPTGSISKKLAKGKELLRKQLARRGMTLCGEIGALLMAEGLAGGAPPPTTIHSLVKLAGLMSAGETTALSTNVSALMKGAFPSMLSKLKAAVLVSTIGFLLAGSGWLLHQTLAAKAPPAQARADAKVLSDENFSQVQKLIKPQPEESLWRLIPWETNLHTARKKAAAEGKPLLIWAGGGSAPLGGC